MATHKLSQEFSKLAEFCSSKDFTLRELAQYSEARTQALLTLVLSIPFLLFIPLPGLSMFCGVFICLNGFRIAAKKKLWFPPFLMRKKFSSQKLKHLFLFAHKWTVRLEKWIKPRGKVIHAHPFFERFNGSILATCGFFLILPLPPGTNFLPGLTTLLVSLGVLEEDGACLIAGYFFFLCTLAFFTLLPFFGVKELTEMFSGS